MTESQAVFLCSLADNCKAWPDGEKEIPAFKKNEMELCRFFSRKKGGMDMDPIYAAPQIHNSICKKLPSNVVNYWNTLIHYV